VSGALHWSPEIPTMSGWYLLDGDAPCAVLIIDATLRATRAPSSAWRPTTYAGRSSLELVGHALAGAPLVILTPRDNRLHGIDLPPFTDGEVSLTFPTLPGIPLA
jgi:hypothetical protein